MPNTITVNIAGVGDVQATHGISLFELSEQYSHVCERPILVAKVDNELRDLSCKVIYDSTVEFFDITDPNGFRAYQRGVSFMMVYAVKAILGKKERVVVAHSINKNYYCELPNLKVPISEKLLRDIEKYMWDTVEKDLPIEMHSLPRESAIKIAEDLGYDDTVDLLKYCHTHTINFYKLSWLHNYFYGEMAPRTGRLNQFKLMPRANGFMLQFPSIAHDYGLEDLSPENRLTEVFNENKQWVRIMKTDTVGALNSKLCQDGSAEIIRVAEALHEKKVAMLADQIMSDHRTIILIAGPTSSGKTSLAHRLGVQLRVNGAIPHIMSLDNYYLDRDFCPRDEFGNFDFETIKAIDTDLISKHLQALLNGEEVHIPTFNFLTGKPEYKGNKLKFKRNDVLIMEGIHGLNELISQGVPDSDKYRIFISALTQINVDDHNRIPTSDTRLLRRIVRDFRTRGSTAAQTISMWPSVQRGEAKYIYPCQEYADAFFNSALVYEMGVLKQFAEPLLFGIEQHEAEYTEARRLIKFLVSFLSVPSETIPQNSILREFVGGSSFYR
ncbi:MAG: nucleoside kinase [Firmicutes bacterium]|nr:nucleoside kinase [Bacillota bacterium]